MTQDTPESVEFIIEELDALKKKDPEKYLEFLNEFTKQLKDINALFAQESERQ